MPRYFRDNGEFLEKERADHKIESIVFCKDEQITFGRKILPPIFLRKVCIVFKKNCIDMLKNWKDIKH